MDVSAAFLLTTALPPLSVAQITDVSLSPRPPEQFIPPVQEPYQYIIFRASEVKDLAVDEPTPRRNVHDDPAVLGVSTHGSFASPYGDENIDGCE